MSEEQPPIETRAENMIGVSDIPQHPAASPAVLNYTQPLNQSTTSPNNALKKTSNLIDYPQNAYPQAAYTQAQQNFPQSTTGYPQTGTFGQFSQTQFPATTASIPVTPTFNNNINNSYGQQYGSFPSHQSPIFSNDTTAQPQLQQLPQQQQPQQQHYQQSPQQQQHYQQSPLQQQQSPQQHYQQSPQQQQQHYQQSPQQQQLYQQSPQQQHYQASPQQQQQRQQKQQQTQQKRQQKQQLKQQKQQQQQLYQQQLYQQQLYQQQLYQQQLQQQQLQQQQQLETEVSSIQPTPEKETKTTKEKLTPTQGQKRERPQDSRKNANEEYVPKRQKHQYDDSDDLDMMEEKSEKEEFVEERKPIEQPVDDVEIEVTWPDDAKIEKEEKDENTLQQYERVIVGGTTYSVGDSIALWAEPGSKSPAPIGTIKSLYTDGEANTVEICWFYRIEETFLKGSRRQKIGPAEVFLSSHRDENDVESIAKKVTVKFINDIVVDDYIKEADHFYYKKKYNHVEKCFEDL